MGTGSIDNSIVLDASGKEIQVSAYIAKKLKPSEIVYFKNLVKYDLDTLKAYTETFPNSTIVNAKKNKSKFDRKVRVKVPDDYQRIKELLDSLTQTQKNVVIEIKDSISITSSLIGYFTKLVQKEGIDLSIKVGDPSLMELFEDLNLVTLFKVRKA